MSFITKLDRDEESSVLLPFSAVVSGTGSKELMLNHWPATLSRPLTAVSFSFPLDSGYKISGPGLSSCYVLIPEQLLKEHESWSLLLTVM